MDADFAALEDGTATIDGTGYSCILGPMTVGDEPAEGGFVRAYDASIYIRASLFTAEPITGVDVLITNGTKERTFRMYEKVLMPDNVYWELRLKSVD